ncbi:hypothetical protein CspHIS471_0105660 [Cutaneotrichosporon sp. HIS471]|nr:hypothetical protein CspHIS471_0105660 [Cutaneotrichosporon sp. HIS471]
MKFFALAAAALAAITSVAARPDIQPVSELESRGENIDPRFFGFLWGNTKCLGAKSVECSKKGMALDSKTCQCSGGSWKPGNWWEQETDCGDNNAILNCWSKGYTCDKRCQCQKPPTVVNKCTDLHAICKCAGKGMAVNPDCSCRKTCNCWDQWACCKKGGKLDENCNCVVPSKSAGDKPGKPGHGWWRWKRDGLCGTETACPLFDGSSEYECLDTKTHLESCGGCASEGTGRDCNTIAGAAAVACVSGECVVSKCLPGFESNSTSSCIPRLSAQL